MCMRCVADSPTVNTRAVLTAGSYGTAIFLISKCKTLWIITSDSTAYLHSSQRPTITYSRVALRSKC